MTNPCNTGTFVKQVKASGIYFKYRLSRPQKVAIVIFAFIINFIVVLCNESAKTINEWKQ